MNPPGVATQCRGLLLEAGVIGDNCGMRGRRPRAAPEARERRGGRTERRLRGDTTRRGDGGPRTVFAALAEIIYQGSDVAEMYAAICVAATLTVPGCDHASLLVRKNDGYVTVGASDRLAQRSTTWNGAPATDRASMPSRRKLPRSKSDLTTPSQWPQIRGRPARRDAGARRHGLSDSRRQTQGRCAQPVQRNPQRLRRRIRRTSGGARFVRQRGHQRHRKGRRRRQPAARITSATARSAKRLAC